jgi:DNA-binding transcriptional LysR family regulator
MNMFDLNLLRVFDAVWRHGNLGRAAAELQLTQSTLSHALARLRLQLGDPLFVRTGHGVQPSARAVQLAPIIETMLSSVRDHVLTAPDFDPKTTCRTFTIALTDVGEIAFLPKLLHQFSVDAPLANVRAVSVLPQDLLNALASGKVDLAIGYFPDLQAADTFQQRLFTEGFVCLVRTGHPAVNGNLTQKLFQEMPHVVMQTEGRTQEIAEDYLKRNGIQRREALRLPHFFSIAAVIAATDLIVTVPESLAGLLARLADVQVLSPPYDIPSFDVKQHWHRTQHQEPANRWLRELVWRLFNRSEVEPARAPQRLNKKKAS